MQGCVKGEKDIIFVNISWGLGIGIIIDGKVYTGKSGFSGEFGHVNVFDNEILCHCGKKDSECETWHDFGKLAMIDWMKNKLEEVKKNKN